MQWADAHFRWIMPSCCKKSINISTLPYLCSLAGIRFLLEHIPQWFDLLLLREHRRLWCIANRFVALHNLQWRRRFPILTLSHSSATPRDYSSLSGFVCCPMQWSVTNRLAPVWRRSSTIQAIHIDTRLLMGRVLCTTKSGEGRMGKQSYYFEMSL